MEKLFQIARLNLSATSRRAMAALDPIKIVITNYEDMISGENGTLKDMTFEVQNSPTDASLGVHTVTLTDTIYIDSSDFRLQDNPTYYGLAPNKAVGIKYHGGNLICDEVVSQTADGKVTELKCRLDISADRKKPKSFITWVPKDGISCEVRVYDHLFTVPEPTDRWEEELNPKSEILYMNAIVDPSVKEYVDAKHVDRWHSNPALQFERIGYFVVDVDTTYNSQNGEGSLVFNRTVSLKEEVFKKEISDKEAAEIARRKEKAKADKEAKEARMKISVEDFFKLAPEYVGLYSKYDAEGIPTHLADGTELTKSAMKKLGKEQMKHKKALMSANKGVS
jgi:glutaminyl-tRNA synthetase